MIVRAIEDATRDWRFGRGRQDYKTGAQALKQSIATRLRSWKGNCFYATEEGVDWNNYLNIGTKIFLDLDIQRVILQTEGVIRLRSYSSTLDREDRTLAVEATVDSIYGIVEIDRGSAIVVQLRIVDSGDERITDEEDQRGVGEVV